MLRWNAALHGGTNMARSARRFQAEVSMASDMAPAEIKVCPACVAEASGQAALSPERPLTPR